MAAFPTGAEVIEENRSGLIGRAVDRVDGGAKVTGRARYSYEIQEAGQPLYGFILGATIGKGRVTGIDTAAAEAAPGVALVMTHKNAPPQGDPGGPEGNANRLAGAKPYLYSDEVQHFGDPVAFVVAETFEQARDAASLIAVTYQEEPADFSFADQLDHLAKPQKAFSPPDTAVGEFDAAFAAAPVQLDEIYITPIQVHAQMEPHAALAHWEGEKLNLFVACQLLKASQNSVAHTLLIPHDRVRIVSRYIGGGFGGKLCMYAEAILSVLGAKELGRPVKTALTRQQMFQTTGHRSASRQRIRLGADKEGRLTALAHEGVVHTSRMWEFTESVGAQTRRLYAAPNRRTQHRLATLDLPGAEAVRAPGEASGMLSIEVAMDELADRLGIDPIEIRRRNEPTVDPESGKPYSSRNLIACMDEGARRFGWTARNPKPAQTRQGEWWIGVGMSASIRSNYLMPARCGLTLGADGRAVVRQAMTDIGTGTYTILAQIAAEALGLPIEAIEVEIGDSSFPPAPGSGGSFGAASAGSALLDAAMKVREQAAKIAVEDPASPLFGQQAERATFAGGSILIGNHAEPLVSLVKRLAPDGLKAMGECSVAPTYGDFSQHAHGAHFCEVAVNAITGETRLRRMLGVFAAGRILNDKTARSQAIGGMIWGVGQALTEENHVDPRFGSFEAQDLASYHVPVHADIANLDALFIAEEDDKGNPLKIKGVGELGICGAGAAVANAIYNACGVRVRDYPFTPDKIFPHLPPV
ncbi:MAG TPA: xanthine dehydrogenase family protein molybdopterin-binding subunit [Caulobacteraceae bacterium]|nr:xanthine dehydrogenase family protein molybdopterin-binding subunit [Caulobacteraceae bacterium]